MTQDYTGLLLPLLVGGVVGLVGVALLIFGLLQRREATAAERWPTAPGTVVSSQIQEQTRIERGKGRTDSRAAHTPLVEYAYEINGRSFRGSRILPGAAVIYDLTTAQGIVDRYRVGQPVSVYYNPADQAESVLETTSAGGRLLLILGGVLAAIGVLACCAGGAFALLP